MSLGLLKLHNCSILKQLMRIHSALNVRSKSNFVQKSAFKVQ